MPFARRNAGSETRKPPLTRGLRARMRAATTSIDNGDEDDSSPTDVKKSELANQSTGERRRRQVRKTLSDTMRGDGMTDSADGDAEVLGVIDLNSGDEGGGAGDDLDKSEGKRAEQQREDLNEHASNTRANNMDGMDSAGGSQPDMNEHSDGAIELSATGTAKSKRSDGIHKLTTKRGQPSREGPSSSNSRPRVTKRKRSVNFVLEKDDEESEESGEAVHPARDGTAASGDAAQRPAGNGNRNAHLRRRANPGPDPPNLSETGRTRRPPEDGAQMERRERSRQLAEERARRFAVGRGFVDDAGRESEEEVDEPESAAAPPTDELVEAWPGPFQTARDLTNRRSAAAAAREARMISIKTRPVWHPKGTGSKKKLKVPKLQELIIRKMAENIDECIEMDLIYALVPSMKEALCRELCRLRKFLPAVLPYFTEEGTSHLSLPDCSYLLEEDLISAFEKCQGPQLRSVRLSFCGRGMSDLALKTLFESSRYLRELRLEGCYRLSDEGFRYALGNSTHLAILELSSCPKFSGDGLRLLIENCRDNLESLTLDRCPKLSRDDLALIAKFKNLERLSLKENAAIDDDTILKIVSSSSGVQLDSLDLSECGQIQDEGVRHIATNCPNLTSIALDCTKVTNAALEHLAKHCTLLESVSIRSCTSVTDVGLVHLIRKCKLRKLVLNNIPLVTDATLAALKENCRSSIEDLDLSWCRAVTDEGLGLFVDAALSLKRLHLRGCTQITGMFIRGHSNPDLEVLGHRLVEGLLS